MKTSHNIKSIQQMVSPIGNIFSHIKHLFAVEKAFCIIFIISFFILVLAHFLMIKQSSGAFNPDVDEFAVGKVADADFIAGREVSYIDQTATDIRTTARLQTVYPVFKQDQAITSETVTTFNEFVTLVLDFRQKNDNLFPLSAVQEHYPNFFSLSFLQWLAKQDNLDVILTDAQEIIKKIMAIGIASIPKKGLEKLNPDTINLLMYRENNREYMNMPVDGLITIDKISSYIREQALVYEKDIKPESMDILIRPFLQASIIFDEKKTKARVQETLKKITPVMLTIEKNQKIIKRGFIITETQYEQLQEYMKAGSFFDTRKFAGALIFLICLYIAGIFSVSKRISRTKLKESQKIFLILISVTVYLIILFSAKSPFFIRPLDFILILPAAMTAMLVLTLISAEVAASMVFFISIVILAASGFQLEPALFAVFSGLSAVGLMNLTGQRIALIKTAVQLAIIHPVITGVLIFIFPHSYTDIRMVFIGSVINGFMSGVFVLGFLPILEDRMNTPTCFRLMELSDLNSPIMKQMLVTISGTYNHSMMVGTLAEVACREIGANALLARVGAYYHDIGKMANGEYFIENQTSYNKHLDLNPRLSATIIRSHVKLGIEKAQELRLPQEVIDIISEHHGNGLVQYFYSKAKELDPNVDSRDFSYPGQPPRTKESAVVMLADITEAACRTLENPSFSRLEKFIGKLIKGKIDAGQLENSDLTLRELKIIQSSFTDVLAGYYHSRVKYPNQKDPDENETTEDTTPKKDIPEGVKHYLTLDLDLETTDDSV